MERIGKIDERGEERKKRKGRGGNRRQIRGRGEDGKKNRLEDGTEERKDWIL